HTRSKRDWSSDVCSSDLQGEQHRASIHPCTPSAPGRVGAALRGRPKVAAYENFSQQSEEAQRRQILAVSETLKRAPGPALRRPRSEERRVGKEWRCWRSA